MKILIVNKFFRIVGGSDTYCFNLADALKQAGHEVVFFSMRDSRNWPDKTEDLFVENIDYNTTDPVKKLKYAAKYPYSLAAKRKIEKLLDREKPDVVHLNHIHHQITLSVVSEIKKRNIPMVFVMHDVICACPNYMMLSHGQVCEKCLGGHFSHCIRERCVKDSLFKSVLAAAEQWNYYRMGVYNDIDAYIAPSAFVRDKVGSSGFTSRPIYHFKNLLPMDTVYGKTVEREDYILYFGRLSREKGLPTLLRAVSLMEQKKRLYVAGTGDLRPMLEQFVAENHLEDRVRFLGFLSGEELESTIRRARCVVLASEWYENGPYAIAEASACGTPCIVSNLGGLPEAVEDGVNGYVCQAGNAGDLAQKMDRIFTLSPEEYEAMCQAAVEKAKRDYNAQAYLDKLLALYTELLEQKRRNP